MKSILTLAAMAAFAFTAFAADPTPAASPKPDKPKMTCCGAACNTGCCKDAAAKDKKCCGEKCACSCCAK